MNAVPAAPHQIPLRQWLGALAAALLVYLAWRLWGAEALRWAGRPPTHLLLHAVTLGQMSVAVFPPQPGYGWLCVLPDRFMLLSGQHYHPVLPLLHASIYLLPTVTFMACLGLAGGAARRQPTLWLAGLGFGVGWYILCILLQMAHVLALAVARQPSPFFPSFQVVIPPLPIVGHAGWADWVYPSGLLLKVMVSASNFVGILVWFVLVKHMPARPGSVLPPMSCRA